MSTCHEALNRHAALLLVDPDTVPRDQRDRIEATVDATWSSDGITAQLESGRELERFAVLVTGARTLPAPQLRRMPGLRLIVATGTSFHYIDTDHCRSHGITVCNTPDYTGPAVAEHAIALLLSLARHVRDADAAARTGRAARHLGREIAGKTVGIAGMGNIGARVAKLALAFDADVLFFNRSAVRLDGAEQVTLEVLLARSDYVFLTLPLATDTRHLVNAERIAAMKPDALLINVSAEELVEPEALCAALREATIGGAALDIVEPGRRYRDIPNLILTPAIGWYTAEGLRRRAERWVETLVMALRGAPTNIVVAGHPARLADVGLEETSMPRAGW
jgi:glycerate dehydrogenase/D-3-phosphoglycerate dehydrogenase